MDHKGGIIVDSLNQSLSQAIEAQRDELATIIVDEQWRLEPELNVRYDETGRAKCVQDVNYNLTYLAEAIACEGQSLFGDYVDWVHILFEGLGIPARDLADSLRITADVLHQRFPGEMGAIADPYIEAGLTRLAQSPSTVPSFINESQPLATLAGEYMEALRRGDRHAASRLVLDAVEQGTSIKDIYLHVFQRCQYEMGRLWQTNQVSVAQEHFCTAATQLIMSQLYPYLFSTERIGRRMVATCVGDELHELGIRMVADFFEMEGWDTYYLGSNTPAQSVLQSVADQQADVLAISATMTFHVKKVRELIDQVRAAYASEQIKIIVGGYPFNVEPELWRQIGADGYARDAQQAISATNALIADNSNDDS